MFAIREKLRLSENVFRLVLEAPHVATSHKPGQFVVIQLDDEFGERIPLSVADVDRAEGTITLIVQVVGKTSRMLCSLSVGEGVAHVLGPLGHPTHIEKRGRVVCVGGGIGAAPVFPIARAFKETGAEVISIIGARSRELVIMEKELSSVSDKLIVCTDDGSYGRKALVTEPLKELCEQGGVDEVVAIGPPIMMKFCAETTRPYAIPTVVSLNTIMVDGTGMCGGCRVRVGDEVKFVCVDGPEFDGHLVDFDLMFKRLGAYKDIEKEKDHQCRLDSIVPGEGE
ncbi:sulfide/dihydroorotate dehydrogenase-like FAD/NAD-binding protein [Spirochaetia bacterium 38H-sp]|uniref:Sulfide/dihydroorotate dehydrogenase-like FAD/NAD-binding protein n=1 Tax=Rarispira pelagica TaxID=3141764 RepID=A0ABU9UDZ2_9SPIR